MARRGDDYRCCGLRRDLSFIAIGNLAGAALLIGTGSEFALCLKAYKAEGVAARDVSMPSWELFELQDQAYRDEVLPPEVKDGSRSRRGQCLAGSLWRHDRC
jgi:hypothetical protein